MYYPPTNAFTDRYNDSSETVKRTISIPKHEEEKILEIWERRARERHLNKSQYVRVLFREDDERSETNTALEMQPLRYAQ